MAGRFIQPARVPGGGDASPDVRRVAYTTGQTFKKGALLVYTAAGEVSECGTDPATTCGVALEAAGSGLGYDMANASQILQVTGRAQEISMAVANRSTIFSMRAVNGGTDPVTPAQTNIDEVYGVAKDANGIWTLDIAETTATIFHVVDIDIDNKIFFGKFIESRLDTP